LLSSMSWASPKLELSKANKMSTERMYSKLIK
jgi:hypothetical protein